MTRTLERIQPQLLVCGHIRPAYGHHRRGTTEVINASLVDEDYRPVNPVITIEL